MITISQSEMAMWARCPRKWFVTYYLGYVPAHESPANVRSQGTRIHTALEGHYGYGLDPVATLHLLYAIESQAHPDFEAELATEADTSVKMVEGYLEWAAAEGVDAGLQVVATEQDVTVPMPGFPEVTLRAKLDQVFFREAAGTLSFMDYKTGAAFDRHEHLELDPQFRFYCLLQHMSAEITPGQAPPGVPAVDGGIVRTLRRVKRSSKSRPPYYAEDEFRYTPAVLSATWLRTHQLVSEIMAARIRISEGMADWQAPMLQLDMVQQAAARPVPMVHDCSWSCPLSGGTCSAMDDGSDWRGILESSGHWMRQDPYAYYSRDGIQGLRSEMAKLVQPADTLSSPDTER